MKTSAKHVEKLKM